MKDLKKIIARTLCFMHQRIFRPIYFFNNYAYFLDFRAQKFPLIFLNLNPFKHQQVLHFGVSNYEKQHKESTYKVLGRSVVFSAFYADFCFCSKLVIITTLKRSYYSNIRSARAESVSVTTILILSRAEVDYTGNMRRCFDKNYFII